MNVVYYKTIFRNQKTGEADFYVVPKEQCSDAINGLLLCHGTIGIYMPKTPLEIQGLFYNGKFFVDECIIPYKTRENTIKLLEYVIGDLSDTQISALADVIGDDIFEFTNKVNCKDLLVEAMSRLKNKSKYAKTIINKINFLKNQEKMTVELIKADVSIAKIELLCKKGITLEQVIDNPYIVFSKYDIPIECAERIAFRNPNLDEYSMKRLKGFVYDAVLFLLDNGNTCCTLDQVTNITNRRLALHGIYETTVSKGLVNVCINELNNLMSYRIVDGNAYIYLNNVWAEETLAIKHIKRLQNNKHYFTNLVNIDDIENKLGIKYNKEQRNAFKAVESSGIKILTGPPGSGKTAVINGLIEHFGKNGVVRLAATTGMAAKVMSSACKREAETVNLMLNVVPFSDTTMSKDINNPIEASLIIVDEVSMLDLQMLSILVQAIKSGSILLLVGDEFQLQSVGYGNVLHDLLASSSIETYKLTKILRQSGTICENAQKINKGNYNVVCDSSFNLYRCDTNDDLLSIIKENIKSINNVQLLCPTKKGNISTNSLNTLFQDSSKELLATYGNKSFFKNERVIMTKNNYGSNYINGDIGMVIGEEEEHLIVKFSDKTLCLSRQDMHNMDFAYCVTIHKSQGSEFSDVHIVLPEETSGMMSRRLIYTAVTRAKEKVSVYSVGNAFEDAVMNKGESKRLTLLTKRLLSAKIS